MANVPGHKRIVSGTAIRGPYTRKTRVGTQRQEVEGFVFRDSYRTGTHEMWDFLGGAPQVTLQQYMIDNVTNADTAKIPVATGNTAVANFVMPRSGFISAASYGSNTAFTQNGTNFFTITSNVTSASTTVLSTTAHVNTTDANAAAINGGVNLVANTDYALTLSTATTRYVKKGDIVTFTATVSGTLGAVQDAPYITMTLQFIDWDWHSTVVATAGQPLLARVANTINGEALLQLDATSEAQTAAMHHGDQLTLAKVDVATPMYGEGPWFECRVKVGGNATVGTNDKVIFGVGTAFNSTFTSISKYALFKLSGNMNLVLDSKDGTTTNTSVVPTLGTTALTAGTYYYFSIDFSDPTNVLFWYDDGKVDIFLGGLNMGALAATDLFQPIIAVQRSSGTDAVDVTVDMVSWKSPRY